MLRKKILIVKINAIGDVVMALPMVTYLRSVHPNVHITWLCGTAPAPLLKATGIIDEIIQVDEKELLTGDVSTKIWSVMKIWKILAFRFFDQVFIGNLDPRYRLLTLFTHAREKKSLSLMPGRYHSDEYVRMASGIEGPLQCKTALPEWHHPLADHLKQLLEGAQKMIALAPGGAKNSLADNPTRRWPIDHYVELAKALLKQNYSVVLTGDKSDEWILPYFSKLQVLNLVGQVDLVNLVSLYQKCALLVTHDSGPLHLGKLAKIPLIALFGPTMPSEKVDSNSKVKVLWGGENLPCRPCYDGKHFPACANNLCMRGISPKEVLTSALELLGASRQTV